MITGLLVINETNRYPRTDDAEIFANFIGIAPQVDGPITQLAGAGQRLYQAGRAALSRSIPAPTNTLSRRQSPIWTRWKARSPTSAGPSHRR